MDKVLQRVQWLKQHAAKQKARKKQLKEGDEAWNRNQQRLMQLRVLAQQHRDARKTWKTNWATGPLAPRLDVGDQRDKYGATSIYYMQPAERQVKSRRWMPIEKGDRVVATFGPDRGKISYVQEIDEDRQVVQVRDVNVEEVSVPDWALREDSRSQSLQKFRRGIPIEHVKLVYPLPHPETGIPRDVIIDRLEKVYLTEPEDLEEDPERRKEYRAIAGSDIIIPWPERLPPEDPEPNEIDTPRITVDEITFRPYLLRPPMPTSVIDELRNKYSRLRTRHTPEFEQKVEAYAEREDRRKALSKTMRTPLQELAELRARQKAADERVLSDDQLAKIGAVMAQGRQSSAQAATVQ